VGRITAALYARVSSDGQARENTVASQVAALLERAAAEEAVIGPDHAYVDEGHSGATLARPALERLRDAVAGGEIDRVYVHAPDRLARRYAYQVLLIDEFRRAGVDVAFLNRPIGGSAEDDLLLQVQGVIAEYERARILERSRRGRRHAARSGKVSAMCGAPYGYRYLGRYAAGGAARFEIVEDEARVVRQLFTWIGIDRISLREACRRLQNLGHSTRTGLQHWDTTTICGMLRNPAYQGNAMFGRTRSIPPAQARLRPIRGRSLSARCVVRSHAPVPREEWIGIPVPAIVDAGLFEAVQSQLEENRRRKRDGRRRPGWLLQGLVVCRQCGYAFYGKMARGRVGDRRLADYGYYRCTGSDGHKFGGTALCSNPSLRSDKLEQAVWREVEMVLDDPRRVAAEHERRSAVARGGNAREDVDALDRQLARLRRGIDRLIDGYAEGIIEIGEFKPRLAGLKQRLTGLQQERDTVMAEHDAVRSLHLVIGRLNEFADRVRAGLDQLDWNGRREIIRALVRRIEIDRDQIEVVFRVPGAPPPSDGGTSVGSDAQTGPPSANRQHCGRSYCVLVGEDADDIGASFDLAVQSFERVGRVQLRSVSGGEVHVGQHVGLGIVHESGELRQLGTQLIGDLAPLRLGCFGILLCEGRRDEGGRDATALASGMGQEITHQMYAAALPSGMQHLGDGGLQSFVCIGDHQLHTAEAAASKLAQEFGPEGFCLGGTNIHAEDLASAVAVDADRDDDGDRDDAAGLAHLYIGGVEPNVWPVAFQRAVQEGLHLVVDLAAQPGDLALGDAGHSHGLHQVIDRARGDPLDVGFLDHSGEGLLRHSPWFKEAREVAALAELRNAQLDRAGAGLPIALAVAVAMGEAVGGASAVRRTGEALDLQLHQALRGEADHLAQEVSIGGLLQQLTQAHSLVGHRRVLGWR
jgi:site-specific DNA recombinase